MKKKHTFVPYNALGNAFSIFYIIARMPNLELFLFKFK